MTGTCAGTAELAANPRVLLELRGVSVRFGAIVALRELSLDVRRGELLAVIGPNGAGKTTLFNCLSRLVEVERGTIALDGRSLLALPRHAIARAGIGRTFQHLALFDSLSVLDNVRVGGHAGGRGGLVADALRLRAARDGERRARAQAHALLERFELAQLADTPVGELSFAVKKRVELARALASEPRLLLLDEPAAGLDHEQVEQLAALIRAIRAASGVTILMVEHHLGFVMRVSDRVVALDAGRTLAEGTPAEVRAHPGVVRAYLGAPA